MDYIIKKVIINAFDIDTSDDNSSFNNCIEYYKSKVDRVLELINKKEIYKLTLTNKERNNEVFLEKENLIKICDIVSYLKENDIDFRENNICKLEKLLEFLYNRQKKDYEHCYKKYIKDYVTSKSKPQYWEMNIESFKRKYCVLEENHKKYLDKLRFLNTIFEDTYMAIYNYFDDNTISGDFFKHLPPMYENYLNNNTNTFFDDDFLKTSERVEVDEEKPKFSPPIFYKYYMCILEKVYALEIKKLKFRIEKNVTSLDKEYKIEDKEEYSLRDIACYLNKKYDTLQKKFKRDEYLSNLKKSNSYIIPREYLYFILFYLSSKAQGVKVEINENFEITNFEECREYFMRSYVKNFNKEKVYNKLKDLFDIFYVDEKENYTDFYLNSSFRGIACNLKYIEKLLSDSFLISINNLNNQHKDFYDSIMIIFQKIKSPQY